MGQSFQHLEMLLESFLAAATLPGSFLHLAFVGCFEDGVVDHGVELLIDFYHLTGLGVVLLLFFFCLLLCFGVRIGDFHGFAQECGTVVIGNSS